MLPDSLTDVDANPFVHCDNLKSIQVSPENPVLETIDGVLFDTRNSRLLCYPCAFTAQNYSIPKGTQVIGEEAFAYCSNLKNVVFPESVTEIEPLAFYSCHGLTTMTIPDSVTIIGKDAFRDCNQMQFYDVRLF